MRKQSKLLSIQTDYALHILNELEGKKRLMQMQEIIYNTRLPYRFAARVAAKLKNRGIIVSKTGRTGGYRLGANYKNMLVSDFIRIFGRNRSV